MAVSSSSISSGVNDARTAGFPVFLGEHLIRVYSPDTFAAASDNLTAFWGLNGSYANDEPSAGSDNRDPSSADDPAAANCRLAVQDGSALTGFGPGLTSSDSQSNLYLHGDLSSDDSDIIDAFAVGWDLTDCPGYDVSISLRLHSYQDDSDLTSVLQTIRVGTDDERQGFALAMLTESWEDVGGFRLQLSSNNAGESFDENAVPYITELMLGRRRQLGVQPRRPYSLDAYRNATLQFFAETGFTSTVTQHRGRWDPGDISMIVFDESDRFGINNVQALRDLGFDTLEFSEPFALIPNEPESGTSPIHRTHLIQVEEPGFDLREVSAKRFELSQRWRELPPFHRVRV